MQLFFSLYLVLLLFAIFLTLGVYRKWKIEQEIEGLLWKINPDCLRVCFVVLTSHLWNSNCNFEKKRITRLMNKNLQCIHLVVIHEKIKIHLKNNILYFLPFRDIEAWTLMPPDRAWVASWAVRAEDITGKT